MTLTNSVSLREYEDRAGRIIFHIRGVRTPVIITEGPTDAFILESMIDRKRILDVAGRVNVLNLSEKMLVLGESRFVSVFDRDFCTDHYREDGPYLPYDANDLESMLVEMGLLGDLLRVKGQEEKIKKHGGIDVVLGKLKDCVVPVSRLRRRNEAARWGLDFDSADLTKFITQTSLELEIDRYCSSLYNDRIRNGDGNHPSLQQIKQAAKESDEQLHYRGKDLLSAASVALRNYIGSLNKAQADVDGLIDSLYMAGKHALGSSDWADRLSARLEGRAA
ncbi:hypothetical protein K1X13_06340 [Nocardioides sp. WL0053]|uniref:DUF4435 domain-containing protein n=1 Tax=Nocardioides jiangsuensis TaxID=2866161 RepID=A0ABS7RHB6_9ACTN|nr:hypothetical protein [Nocardioides jiangsuensis]MBY9074432.1 hypothetical protein [Nocardioides jiangsuensis]